ncbi:MAG: gamma-glutamyltransferase [Alphaproteobacteria bacterium]
MSLLLAACSTGEEIDGVTPISGFAGVVAADEPRAAVVGRDVLGLGGTAVDAAVAMYFTMAVTIPSRASLGGGGVCVTFDAQKRRGEAINFLPRSTASGGIVPSGMRAMAVLHARHGILRWEQMLTPAERLARFGHAVSRAFSQDLAAEAERITANPELMRLFMARSGRLARTGDRIIQSELSTVISGIRQQGAGYLHSGPFARRLADASSVVGMPLSVDDVRDSLPKITEAVAVPSGKDVAFFAPPRATGGVVAAQIWEVLTNVESFGGAEDARLHAFAEASARAFAQRAAWMAPDGSSREPVSELVAANRVEAMMAGYSDSRHTPAATFSPPPRKISSGSPSAGFVVGDRFGNAVACSFTMNRPFGAGRVAEGTGILLAAPPRSPNDGANVLTAVVVGNVRTGTFRFAGTAAGGAQGATALARVMLETLDREQPLATAVAAPRVHHGGAPDELWLEPGIDAGTRAGLESRGHTLREMENLGRVNAFYCDKGLRGSQEECIVTVDPRGAGLASIAQ